MRRILLLVALLVSSASPLAAQSDGLPQRMRALARAVEHYEGLRAFFPTQGEWTWVSTVEGPGRARRVEVRRFPAVETETALSGDVCGSFIPPQEIPIVGSLGYALQLRVGWRRLAGNRFVLGRGGARSPVFVKWRREDGRWVIDTFGDTRLLDDDPAPLPEIAIRADDRPGAPLRLPFTEGTPVAAERGWYTTSEAIWADTRFRFVKDGDPRTLQPGDVVRYGEIDHVPVFAEPAALHGRYGPRVMYVLVSLRGEFQPYTPIVVPPRCP